MNDNDQRVGGYVVGLGVLGVIAWYLYGAFKNREPSRMARNIRGQMYPLYMARKVGERIGINWLTADFPVEQLARGIVVEFEHGTVDPRTDVTDDDVLMTAKIAWAHLNEFPDYYDRLDDMEYEAEKVFGERG